MFLTTGTAICAAIFITSTLFTRPRLRILPHAVELAYVCFFRALHCFQLGVPSTLQDPINVRVPSGVDEEQCEPTRGEASEPIVNRGRARGGNVHPQVYLACWEISIFLICFLSDAP